MIKIIYCPVLGAKYMFYPIYKNRSLRRSKK